MIVVVLAATVVLSASAGVVVRAFVASAASVADDAVLPAAFWHRRPAGWQISGLLYPALSAASDDLSPVEQLVFPAVAGTSDPSLRCRCLVLEHARLAEDPWDGPQNSGVRCCFPG